MRTILVIENQYTRIGLCDSETENVVYGVPQGSVLGPLLFALFCDDLPECARGDDEELEMYPDDTTLICIREMVDQVVSKMNKTLDLVNNVRETG